MKLFNKKEKKMKVNKKNRTFDFCDCWDVRRPKDAWLDMFGMKRKKNGERSGEVFELLNAIKKWDKEEIVDEISDMAWGVGRLLSGLFGKEYFNIWLDERHYQKKLGRMRDYQCIRSKNNNGCISK
jgi:hypothetical protein